MQSLSYVSPQAILNALLPQAQLPAAAAEAGGDGGRVAAFKRYIAGWWGGIAGLRLQWVTDAHELHFAWHNELCQPCHPPAQSPTHLPTHLLNLKPCFSLLQTWRSAAAAPRCPSSLPEQTG